MPRHRRRVVERRSASAAVVCAVTTLLACGQDVTGPGPPPQISVTPTFLDLVLGAARQLAVTVRDGQGDVVANPPLTFESSDPARVTVSLAGVVTAHAPGEAAVTVATDGASAYASVRALSPAQLHLSPDSTIATVDDTLVFTAQALDFAGNPVPNAPVAFESSNPLVLTIIGPLGRVRAAAPGTALVRVRSGTTTDSSRILVYGAAAAVSVTPDSLRLLVADDAPLVVQVRDANGTVVPSAPITFAVADPAVARVSGTGVVRAVGVGITIVTVTSGTAAASIPVVGAAVVSLTPATVVLTAADTVQLVAVARDSVGTTIPGVAFNFSSTDTAVARVSATAVLTYAGPGAAYIIAVGGFDQDTTIVTALFARTPVAARAYSVAVSAADAVYVTGHDAGLLFRVDPATWSVVATLQVGQEPTDVAFDNAGTRAYVTNQLSQSLSVVDPATDTELGRIALPADPYVATVAPGDSLLYVSASSGRVYVVHLPTGAVTDSITTSIVNALVIRDTLLYAGLPDDHRVDVYDRRSGTQVGSLATGGRPQGLAFSPDGAELYVADENGALQFWNVAASTHIATLPLPANGPFDVAVQPGTGRPFVTGLFQGTVYVVDPGTRSLERTFALGGDTRRIAFRANGDGVVANDYGWVDVVR